MALITARHVADWMLLRARAQPAPLNLITNKKIQKLVYYAQAWHLANLGRPLFDDEIQAWVHGPVVPHLYHAFKQFGYRPIVLGNIEMHESIDGDTAEYLSELWDEYGHYDANYLELLTHSEPPWQIARSLNEIGENPHLIIQHDWMRDYYAGVAAELSATEW